MKSKAITIVGVLFVLLGLVALVHPTIKMPAKQTEVQIGSVKTPMETRRVFDVPPITSVIFVLCGGFLIYLGPRHT